MKNNQRGGIISFLVVALALTGLLVGGLYLSKHQARVARETDTSTPQVSDVKKESPSEEKTDQTTTTTTPSTQTKPADTTPKPATPAPTTTTPSTPTPQTNRVAATGPSEALPSTGSGDTALVTVALGALTFTGYRLVQSRRSVHRSALRR